MRETMRPVSLSRIVETASLAERELWFSKQFLAEYLHSSEDRAKEVAEEMVNIGFLEKDEQKYRATQLCSNLLTCVRNNDWAGIHTILMDYSFFRTFFSVLESIEPATPDEILVSLQSTEIAFNETSRDVLCDWGERIGSIQRNIFSNQYFSVINHESDIIPAFVDTYCSLNIKTGISLRQRYVEIPKIREYVCQNLRIPREQFDSSFIQMCLKNIGKIELAGAPVTTRAKKSARKVKNVRLLEFPDKITMKLSSNQFLNGISIGNKSYYYVAYHGGDLK